jgi:hypothetical protein
MVFCVFGRAFNIFLMISYRRPLFGTTSGNNNNNILRRWVSVTRVHPLVNVNSLHQYHLGMYKRCKQHVTSLPHLFGVFFLTLLCCQWMVVYAADICTVTTGGANVNEPFEDGDFPLEMAAVQVCIVQSLLLLPLLISALSTLSG